MIITDRSPMIFLWNSITHQIQQIDSGMKENLSVVFWSKANSSMLFVGSCKGNILLYNNQTSRKIPILGKHNKKIVCGAWSENNMIAVVGEDKVLTINNGDGDTVSINSLKFDGANVKFLHVYYEEKANSSDVPNSVALVLNSKMFYIVNLNNSENPYIFTFQEWYETIVDYFCYPNGNLFAAFSSGMIVTISTCYKNLGNELLQIKAHKDSLSTMGICIQSNRIATCSENK